MNLSVKPNRSHKLLKILKQLTRLKWIYTYSNHYFR